MTSERIPPLSGSFEILVSYPSDPSQPSLGITTTTMKIYHLHRLLPFLLPLCLYPVVVGQQEEGGTCDAEGGDTCASGANDDVEAHCFPDGMCFDSLDEAFISYYEGSESENSVSIPLQFPRAYGEDQQVSLHESESYGETMEVIAKMHNYMVDVFQNDTAKSYREECKMRHELCAFWAAIGECEAVSLKINSMFGRFSVT